MSFWDYLAPIAGALVGGQVGFPMAGAAVGSGLARGIQSGSPLQGALAAGGSYGGSYLGSKFAAPALNNLGSQVNPINGSMGGGPLSTGVGSALSDAGVGGGGMFGNSTFGDVLGTGLGGILGSKMASSLIQEEQKNASPSGPVIAPYKPQHQPDMATPGSLQQYAGLSPEQTLSGVATKGVYGGGNSPDENKYFLNLVNNRLVDQGGNVAGLDRLNPIENSYLAQLGLTGSNSQDLLKSMSNYAY